ncbi:hypothetical protein Tco_1017120 [Tanacetum coccineum]|uniref:Uncharacterized protein n=1 Tax=Tanacetum coccineum TaxID=301880 RepID=A0ABQ5FRT1_9ASTR
MKKTRILMRLYGVTPTIELRRNLFKARHVTQQDYGITTRKVYAVTLLLWKDELSKSALRRNVDTLLRHHGFVGYPFDYRVPLSFGSIAGGLDHVNPVIRLPLEHGISRVTMPRKTAEDHQNTKSYIPIISHDTSPLREMLINLENRCFHEGRVVFQDFDDLVYVESMFSHIGFDYLLIINEQVCPRFILEFYSQYRVNYTLEGQMLIEFVIQNQFFSYTIEEFGQMLGITSNGACSFTDKWSLGDLRYSVPTSGPYQTDPPCPDEIKNYIQEEREGPVTHIRHDKENVFCLGGNRNHVPSCLCHMLYCIARLFKYVIFVYPELSNDRYVLYDRVMYPLTAQQERKTRKDYGTRRGRSFTSSSSAFGQPSSSHPNNDDNDGNDERPRVQALLPPLILSTN